MTELPPYTHTGVAPLGDLSILESALHSARVNAAELGYRGEPEIATEEVMLVGGEGADATYAGVTETGGNDFAPTALRYVMTWPAESV